jgi:hypothetical protein
MVESSGEIIGSTPLERSKFCPVDDRNASGQCRSTNGDNCDHFEVCEVGLKARANNLLPRHRLFRPLQICSGARRTNTKSLSQSLDVRLISCRES